MYSVLEGCTVNERRGVILSKKFNVKLLLELINVVLLSHQENNMYSYTLNALFHPNGTVAQEKLFN